MSIQKDKETERLKVLIGQKEAEIRASLEQIDLLDSEIATMRKQIVDLRDRLKLTGQGQLNMEVS